MTDTTKKTVVVDINSKDKEIIQQAINNVVNKNFPDVRMTASRTVIPFPNLTITGPLPKGCVNEAVEFVSMKDGICYICMGEIQYASVKSRLKKGNALHAKILTYILRASHEQLGTSGYFTEIRPATQEELDQHASDMKASK